MKTNLFLIFLAITTVSNAQNFGDKKHLINSKTDNRVILDYWKNNSDAEKAIYESAYQIFSNNTEATFAELSKDSEFESLCIANKTEKLGGPMLGNITSNGVSIWIRTLKPSKVEVEINSKGINKKYGPVYSTQESDLSVVIPITGLQASTNYKYNVLIDNKRIEIPENSNFRIPPAYEDTSTVRIAFGSCFHRWGLGNKKLLDQIHDRSPNALLLLGDIAVQDRKNNTAMHRADYLLRDFYPGWNNLVSSVPVYATWDDHDYFANDKAGIPEGYTKADKENIWKVFRNSWNNPSYGFGDDKKGVFLHTRIGPCDIIMTDNRYFRTGEEGSFLGKEQMEWLKEELLNCEAPFKILSCGSMWSDFVSNGKDSWGVNDPDGREEIFKLIEDNNISGVLLISGDRHGARGFYMQRPSGFKFYEFGAASLGARVGPSAKKESWTSQLFGIDGKFAFGEFTFNTTMKDPEVIFRLIGDDGLNIYELKLKKSQLTPENY
jgi:alkaline phosphatase D